MSTERTVVVTGGAGYVGAVLVPKLLAHGHRVRVLDLFLFGANVLPAGNPALECVKGDIRDRALVTQTMRGADAVIHLACISNDPSFELNPALSRSINYECFEPMVVAARDAGVRRFIYASTSSVYGVSDVVVDAFDQFRKELKHPPPAEGPISPSGGGHGPSPSPSRGGQGGG